MSPKAIEPLRDLLADVLARIESLEAKVGVTAPSTSKSASTSVSAATAATVTNSGGEAPSVKAYDVYMKTTVVPLSTACDDVGLKGVGPALLRAYEGIRTIVVLASRSKPEPSTDLMTLLQPHLQPTQAAVQEIRGMRLDRAFDAHFKAITELLTTMSWVLMHSPQQLPASFVKECLGSTEFWTNRIRKEHKADAAHLTFCDAIKKVIVDLTEYIQQYHTTGLAFNPRSHVSWAEAAILLADEAGAPADAAATPDTVPQQKSPIQKRHPTLGNVMVGGNVAGIMGELSKRKNADGTSAATGLKHVNKDQQTWRKEYKKEEKEVQLPAAPLLEAKKKEKKTPLSGLPIFEYQDRGFKWVIEHHTKESVLKEAAPENGILTVDITDPKQQVYLYHCHGITVQINGKFKSLVLDQCEQCAVVYDTLISSAEVVNCKKIQLQVTGICPVFTIDKTVNVLIWLSKESVAVSSFTTSLSSEMNVSFPVEGEDDQKEVPIPEQFVHKISTTDGTLSSVVSDLYN